MDDIKLYICPKCGSKGTIEYFTVQLDGNYKPCGKVYKCSVCNSKLCITDEPADPVENYRGLT